MPGTLKPIKIWVTSAGPNPWKPVIILEELGVHYDLELVSWEELLDSEFKKVCPTGKVPVMYDPNTDLKLWESGAIIEYLIEEYDDGHKLTYATGKEKHLPKQWLMFQMSQQGPFYGQIGWFNVFHSEHLPSVIDRYVKQAERILGVLDTQLDGRTWLVGDKCTYADLSFFMWNHILPLGMKYSEGETPLSKFPNVLAWHERMADRDAVKKILKVRQDMMDKEGLGKNAMPTDVDPKEMVKKMVQDRR